MKAAWIVPAVAVAAGAGFLAQRWLDKSPDTAEPVAMETSAAPDGASGPGIRADIDAPDGAVAADGVTADGDTPAPPALVIPETLPQFSLADREGRMRTLGEWAGKPVMVNYWATWCAPCRREIPLLNELRGNGSQIEVIGIAVDFRDDVLHYASETPIHYPLLIGEEDGLKAVNAVGMQPAFPFTVFADSKQRILTVKIGELHREDADVILTRLYAVDAGTMTREQAKQEIDAGLKETAARRAAAAASKDAAG